MTQKDLPYYVHCFTNLRRDAKKGGAPHKPVLLLSVIEMFERGLLSTPEIYILPELAASFKSHRSEIVTTEHLPRFSLPFYHMRSEPFWTLLPNIGCEAWLESGNPIRGFQNLLTAVRCAFIDPELANILLDQKSRDVLRISILEHYFPTTMSAFDSGTGDVSFVDWLEVSSEEYKEKILELKNSLDENSFQEEVFIRGGMFKREIPKIYNNTCAISGLRVDAIASVAMVDACHIVPFSESYDDSLSNGIALCPNLHRAFDRGLISISDNYTVILNNNFVENTDSVFNLSQFYGKELDMPKLQKHFPSQENIANHRRRHGFA